MKMRSEHYAELEQAVRRVEQDHPDVTLQSYLDRGLTAGRFRWDLLHAACRRSYFKIGDGAGVSGTPLYAYLNDNHIDTALKRITGTT